MNTELAEFVLALVGGVFFLLASIGVLRMPDLFLRLQVSSKASTLGLSCILLAVALHFSDAVVTIRAAVILCFIVLTIPIATHMLARAGYATNVPISDETMVNELAGHYDPLEHVLTGDEAGSWAVTIPPEASAVGRRVADLQLPEGVLIQTIHRGNDVIIPRGPTTISSGDRLTLLASLNELETVREQLGIPETVSFEWREEVR